MDFRFAGAIVTFLIGLGGPGWQAFAQYYSPQVYTAPRAYPDRSLPPVDADGEPQRRPYSVGVGEPRTGTTQDASSRLVHQGDPRDMAALPPEVRPETGPKKELPPQFRRSLVDYHTREPVGTIIVDTPNTYLYLVLGTGGDGRAPAVFAALHGRRRWQSAWRARPVPRSDSLPHSRHQSALHYWNLRILRMYSSHQRGHHGSLHTSEGRHSGSRAAEQARRFAHRSHGGYPVWGDLSFRHAEEEIQT